jgi:hypothetical protein
LIDEPNSSLPANLPISLPANLFVPNSTYLFNIKLCNFLGGCAAGTHTISVQDYFLPSLTIFGPPIRTVNPNRPVVFSASILFPNCFVSPLPSSKFDLSWSVYQNDILSATFNSPVGSTKFRFDPSDFETGLMYKLVCRMSTSFYFSTSSVLIRLSKLKLKPIIVGGDSQYIREGERSTFLGYDSFESDPTLIYQWTCISTLPHLRSSCDSSLSLVVDSWNQITLKALVGHANSTHQLTLTISDPGDPSRSANTSILVNIIAKSDIWLSLRSNIMAINNPAQRRIITGTVLSNFEAFVHWEINDPTTIVLFKECLFHIS